MKNRINQKIFLTLGVLICLYNPNSHSSTVNGHCCDAPGDEKASWSLGEWKLTDIVYPYSKAKDMPYGKELIGSTQFFDYYAGQRSELYGGTKGVFFSCPVQPKIDRLIYRLTQFLNKPEYAILNTEKKYWGLSKRQAKKNPNRTEEIQQILDDQAKQLEVIEKERVSKLVHFDPQFKITVQTWWCYETNTEATFILNGDTMYYIRGRHISSAMIYIFKKQDRSLWQHKAQEDKHGLLIQKKIILENLKRKANQSKPQ